MAVLPNPDSNGIGRYDETILIPTSGSGGFSAYLNRILETISAVVTTLWAAIRPVAITATADGVPIIPTDNVAAFSGAAEVVAIGFDTAHPNYVIEIDIETSTNAVPRIQLVNSSGTPSTSGYDKQRLIVSGTSAAAAQTLNQSNWDLGVTALTGRQVIKLELYGPRLANETVGRARNDATPNPMTTSGGYQDASIQHRSSTQYHGIRLDLSAGTMTGTIRMRALK